MTEKDHLLFPTVTLSRFFLLRGKGGVPTLAEISFIPPTPETPFLFSLHTLVHTGHANFHFN